MVIHLAGLGLVTQAHGKPVELLATGIYAPIPSTIGSLRYISDLSPATYDELPDLTTARPPVGDQRNWELSPLSATGVYYSTDILPGWMQLLSRISPATYVLDAIRKALIDGASLGDLLPDLWPLVFMAFAFIPLGLWGFGRAERYAKRTGRLKRVG